MAVTEKQLANLTPRQPGQGPLPGAGRPKGSQSAKTVIAKWLAVKQKSLNPLTGKEQNLTQLDIITLAQLKNARAGEVQAYNALLDRMEGKPKQINELTGADGTPLAAASAPQVIIVKAGEEPEESLPIATSE